MVKKNPVTDGRVILAEMESAAIGEYTFEQVVDINGCRYAIGPGSKFFCGRAVENGTAWCCQHAKQVYSTAYTRVNNLMQDVA